MSSEKTDKRKIHMNWHGFGQTNGIHACESAQQWRRSPNMLRKTWNSNRPRRFQTCSLLFGGWPQTFITTGCARHNDLCRLVLRFQRVLKCTVTTHQTILCVPCKKCKMGISSTRTLAELQLWRRVNCPDQPTTLWIEHWDVTGNYVVVVEIPCTWLSQLRQY